MHPQLLAHALAAELSLAPRQVEATLALFDDGNTLPFIARYRKEATGGLDEVQLRDVWERATYLRELDERRIAILASIEQQGKLTQELKDRINGAGTKQVLEDLYLPYKPKRRTRATIARERGLEPLADLAWNSEADDAALVSAAAGYVNAAGEVPTADDALAGARDIIAERVAEDPDLRMMVRDVTRAKGVVKSRAITGKEKEVSKFQDYYDFSQRIGELPAHRVLAIRRGEEEGFLFSGIEAPADELKAMLEQRVVSPRKATQQLTLAVRDAYTRLLAMPIEVDLRLEMKTKADEDAIAIFGMNLEQLLLASPAGARSVLGLDPGFRTGVKVTVISRTGAVLDTDTWMLHQPDRFMASLVSMLARHQCELIAIGNGTASRETELAVREALQNAPPKLARPQVVTVNEAGASVYSASDLAREELPELDVSIRGAVSIARRLQDPLAELVKIDPKSIGVGQYQHDVNQPRLKKRLDETVVSCVNRVGVELNTASAALLSYVSGVGPALAQNIVTYRDSRGGFASRKDLLEVPRLGAKAFEQAAGFLRVREGKNPLDHSAVHPERYALVERMATDLGVPLASLVGNAALAETIDLQRYVSADVGLPTLRDIVAELARPGRDPREGFEAPAFRSDVTQPKDLSEGMVLEGVVTNIVAFGAFVDVGVHQDGLVHVSQLSDRYVTDAASVVKVGQRVKVTVMGVDLERNRIALSMKSQPGAVRVPGAPRNAENRTTRPAKKVAPPTPPAPNVHKSGDIAPNGMRFR
ncbi:MAG: Tex-like protein [Gemmatimonadetes bacterium]|nr:Tex-like protein [Gemmatimonadota bacterium]